MTGQWGANAAIIKGRLAGIGVARSLGKVKSPNMDLGTVGLRKKIQTYKNFAEKLNALAYPPVHLSQAWQTNETILCRCEAISYDTFHHCIDANPYLSSADSAKLLSRVGMGWYQGRLCYANAARFMARHKSIDMDTIEPFTTQFLIKTIPIQQIGNRSKNEIFVGLR